MEQAEFDRKLAEIRGRAYTTRRQAEVNKRFNETLSGLTVDNADATVLSLGMPNALLMSAGMEAKEMKLYGNEVIKKMKKHGFTLDSLTDLPRAVANPIAVFTGSHTGSHAILTELNVDGRNVLVSVSVGKGGVDVDFNVVTSIYGKNSDSVVEWLKKGLATYINKRKALDYLHHSAPIAVTSNNEELSDATNIIESFENPSASRYEVSFAFENLTEERARELGYKSFRGQYLRSGTDTPNAKMRAEFGDMSVEEAREKFVSDFVVRIFGGQERDKKIRAFEDYLLRQGIEPHQSGKSESRYYYYNGVKYRFSGHLHPSGSMTDSTFNVVDFAADPHLIDGVEFMRSPQGVVYGFVTGDGVIYLNPSVLNLNTPIHEFGHLWNSFVRRSNPTLWKQGADAVRNSVYWERVNSNPAYSIFSLDGKLVAQHAIASPQATFALPYASGVYVVKAGKLSVKAIR